MRVFPLLIFVIILSTIGVGASFHEADPTFDVYNWSNNFEISNNFNFSYNNLTNISDFSERSLIRLNNVIFKMMEQIIYSYGEFGEWSVEYGFLHPEHDYMFFTNIIIYLLIAATCAPFLLPLILAIYLFIKWIIKKIKGDR